MSQTSKNCPHCGLTNPDSVVHCDCGYNFDTDVLTLARDDRRGRVAAKAVKVAWIVAVAQGCLAVVASALSPFFHLVGVITIETTTWQAVFGLLLISFGLALKRGDRFAAWCLVALETFNVLSIIWVYNAIREVPAPSSLPPLLLPIIILFVMVRGALYLQKHGSAPSDAETWVRALYELAFLQAAWTAVLIVWSFALDPTRLGLLFGVRFDIFNLIDVGILVGFGLAAWKRHVWAGYALVLYQLGNLHLYILRSTAGLDVLFIALGFALVYALGTFHLRRLRGQMTGWGRAAVALVVVLVLAASVSFELRRGHTPYQRSAEEFLSRMLAIPGYKERLLASQTDPVREARNIALKGATRLTDANLIERTRLYRIILSSLDEHNCAEQLRGGRGTIEPALQKIPAPALEAWFNLAYAAAVAEIGNTPPVVPDPPDDAIAEAVAAIRDLLPEDDAARFEKVRIEGADSFAETSDSATCWLFRTIVDTVPQLEPRYQRIIARLLVAQ